MLTRTNLLFSWTGKGRKRRRLEKIDRPWGPICRQTELGELRLLLLPRSGICNPICNDAAGYWVVSFLFLALCTFAFRVFLAAVASVTASDFIPPSRASAISPILMLPFMYVYTRCPRENIDNTENVNRCSSLIKFIDKFF